MDTRVVHLHSYHSSSIPYLRQQQISKSYQVGGEAVKRDPRGEAPCPRVVDDEAVRVQRAVEDQLSHRVPVHDHFEGVLDIVRLQKIYEIRLLSMDFNFITFLPP